MRWIVLGRGLFGWNLAREFERRGLPYVLLARDHVDLFRPVGPQLAPHLREGDVVVNAAAFREVDACEEHPEEAMRVNAEAVAEIAEAVAKRGARLVHISTDAVLRVTNVYARTKALAEERVRARLGDDALVLRVSTVFAPHPTKPDFVSFVRDRLRTRGSVDALVDMTSSPTYAPDAARAVIALVDAGVGGVHQAVNHPTISRYEFARKVQATWGLAGDVRPARMADFRGFRAERPANSTMASTVDRWHRPLGFEACLADYRADPFAERTGVPPAA